MLHDIQQIYITHSESFKIASRLNFVDKAESQENYIKSRQLLIDYYRNFYKNVLVVEGSSSQ